MAEEARELKVFITEQDLVLEASIGSPRSFNPNEDSHGYNRWQCFPAEEVKPKVRTWRGVDGNGQGNVKVMMCDLETWVRNQGKLQIYVGRRAKKATHCHEYIENWKKLTHGQKQVCLSGEFEGTFPANQSRDTPYLLWTWDKLKTKLGCYSYFSDECDIAYWKRQGYLSTGR